MKPIPRSTRIYRWLLRLLPAEFRGDFADEMSQVFDDERREASARGRVALAQLWVRTLRGCAALASREHLYVVARDAGYGLRLMWKERLTTAAIVVTLGLGVGASTAMFTVVKTVMLGLPFRDPDELVVVARRLPRGLTAAIPISQFDSWARQEGPFASMAALWGISPVLTGSGETRRVSLECASPRMFEMLGVAPASGRTFLDAEGLEGAPSTIVISHGFWTRSFARDPGVIGRSVVLDGLPAVVVGIMPPEFDGARAVRQQDGWIAIPDCARRTQREGRSTASVNVYARLKPGVSTAAAETQLEASLEPEPGAGPIGVHLIPLLEQLLGEVREPLLALQGAAAFVLLIGCANVASLLLGRAETRRRELAVRFALGCTRGRMVRQLLVESLVQAIAGGAAGLLCAYWTLEWLRAMIPGWVPRVDRIAIDGGVLAACLAMSLGTGLLFGLLPAWFASHVTPGSTLKESTLTAGPQRRRTRAVLIVAEIALSLALLAGAGLLVRTFLYVRPSNPGFDPRGKLAMTMNLPRSRFVTPATWLAFHDQLQRRLRELPGVQSASVTSYLPLSGFISTGDIELPAGAKPMTVGMPMVDPGYLGDMGIRLLRGRAIAETDRAGAPEVALVNETLARRLWPGEDPLGRQVPIKLLDRRSVKTIVGIVGDTRSTGRRLTADAELIVPFAQNPSSVQRFVLTTSQPAEILGPLARATVAVLDPALPAGDVEPVARITTGRAVAQWRFATALMAAFAIAALVLAAVGLFAVIGCWVVERTPEMGVRMALGASPRDILTLFVRRGGTLVAAGLTGGVALGALTTRFLSTWLVGVEPRDPVTFALAAAVMATVGLSATYLAARRAASIDPLAALRLK